MNRRKIEENFFKFLMILATLIVVGSLVLILGTVVYKGLPSLNLSMIIKTPSGGFYLGKEGGILNAILGSFSLAGGATILSIIISLPVVLYLNIYARKNSFLAYFTRFSFDVLGGVPSIVYGAFGLTIMLFLGLNVSLLAGIITVALLELPLMARAMDEVVRMVPQELKDASYSLGANKLETAFKVIVRQTLPALMTAVLIAFGRGIGDAASVLFTTGFTDSIPTSLFRPAATLPLAIFFQLGSPIPEVQDRAYAAALILTIVILLISIVTRILKKKFAKHTV
ncbi:MAG: phosphate ABC transporter permease PstA [Phycisphaerae bacterium]